MDNYIMKVGKKNNKWKVKKNLNLNTKSKKVYKKDPNRISKETAIRNILQCLEEGNTAPAKNYLRSLLPKKVNYDSKYKLPSDGLTKAERIAKYKAELIAHQTKEEKMAKVILKDMKVKFTFQQEFICKNGKFYFMDFYLPLIQVGIEIDGGYHFTDTQKAKDEERTKDLEKNGIDIYRFTNSEVVDIVAFRRGVENILSKYKIIDK